MNKVVLITGSSRGIGKACAIKYAQNGYDVIINYNNNKESAEQLLNEINSKYNSNSTAIRCDISKEEEVIKMANAIMEKYKKIDVLVNNAGISLDNPISDKTVDEFKTVINLNLIGTFLVTKYISNHMQKGSIINISSTNGIDTNYPESIDYDASKAAVISLSRNFAKALKPNIRVNTVAPGWVNTDACKDIYEEFKKEELNKIYLERFASPEEIANVVYFLSSDEASYINNSVIRVDGGY